MKGMNCHTTSTVPRFGHDIEFETLVEPDFGKGRPEPFEENAREPAFPHAGPVIGDGHGLEPDGASMFKQFEKGMKAAGAEQGVDVEVGFQHIVVDLLRFIKDLHE
jgi:hypothetical protein